MTESASTDVVKRKVFNTVGVVETKKVTENQHCRFLRKLKIKRQVTCDSTPGQTPNGFYNQLESDHICC